MKKIFLIVLLINNVKLFSFADCNVPAGSYTFKITAQDLRGCENQGLTKINPNCQYKVGDEKTITWPAYGLANRPSTITCNDAKICKANGYGANITCPNAKTCSGNGPSTINCPNAKTCSGNGPSTINCQNATTCSVNGGTMNCPNAK